MLSTLWDALALIGCCTVAYAAVRVVSAWRTYTDRASRPAGSDEFEHDWGL